MVGDDHLGVGGLSAYAQDEAFLPVRALQAQAGLGVGGNAVPQLVLREEGEVRSVAGGRSLGPFGYLAQGMLLPLPRAGGREDPLLVDGLADAHPADVVAAALHEDGLRLLAEEALHHGYVLVDELPLQVDRRRGDDDPLFVPDGPGEGWHEVGEGLADAGTGLGDEDAALVEGARDVARQADLALARLVVRYQGRELAALLEHAGDLVLVEHDQGAATRRPLATTWTCSTALSTMYDPTPAEPASAAMPTSASLGLRAPEGWLWTMTSPRSM